jgi:hypothetical protein
MEQTGLQKIKRNVQAFADALRKASSSGKEINVVIIGASSEMVAKFPISVFLPMTAIFSFLNELQLPRILQRDRYAARNSTPADSRIQSIAREDVQRAFLPLIVRQEEVLN